MLGYTPLGVGLETPPGCGPGDPPDQTSQLPLPRCGPGDPPRPINFPLECGPGDPPDQTSQPPPWVWAWRPARHAGIPPPPPWTEFLTHASENITLPQLRYRPQIYNLLQMDPEFYKFPFIHRPQTRFGAR